MLVGLYVCMAYLEQMCPTELHKIALSAGALSPETSLSLREFDLRHSLRSHHFWLFRVLANRIRKICYPKHG